MRRKHLSLLSLLIVGLSITACGSSLSKEASNPTVYNPSDSISDSSDEPISSSSNSSINSSSSSDLSNRVTYGKYIVKEGIQDTDFLQGSPWLNTSIDGVMNKIEKPSLKDDFFANVNYEYLSDYTLTDEKAVGGGKIYESQNRVNEILYELFDNPESTSPMATLKDYIVSGSTEYIKTELETVWSMPEDELRQIRDKGLIFFGQHRICGLCRLPNDETPTLDVTFSDGFVTLPYAMYLNKFMNAGLDFENAINRLFSLVGFEENIDHSYLNEIGYAFESSFDAGWETYETNVGRLTVDIPSFNLQTILEHYGFSSGDKIRTSLGMNRYLDYIYSNILGQGSDNLRKFIVDTIALDSMFLIGRTKFNQYIDQTTGLYDDNPFIPGALRDKSLSDTEYAIKVIEYVFPEFLNREYVANYSDGISQMKVYLLIEEIISAYNQVFQNTTWLSSETKEKVLEKLNTMHYAAFYDTDYLLEPLDEELIEENLINTLYNYNTYYIEGIRGRSYHTSNLRSYFHAYTVNAAYTNADNTFEIYHGLVSSFIDENLTLEELYATVGFIIGHEISHAFDNTGSQYWNGQYLNWWKPEDKAIFQNKVRKLIVYINNNISTLKYEHIDGEKLAGEVIADMGAMRVVLESIKAQNNFNLDRFFKSFAKFWSIVYTTEEAYRRNNEDEHAPSFIRVNLTLAQFDEFINLYNIAQGDNMYIPIEDRIAIW